jgi:hypothetical protein
MGRDRALCSSYLRDGRNKIGSSQYSPAVPQPFVLALSRTLPYVQENKDCRGKRPRCRLTEITTTFECRSGLGVFPLRPVGAGTRVLCGFSLFLLSYSAPLSLKLGHITPAAGASKTYVLCHCILSFSLLLVLHYKA